MPAKKKPVTEPAPVKEETKEAAKKAPRKRAVKAAVPETPAPEVSAPAAAVFGEEALPQPRRSVAFIGSECYPFVKTGGLGDVMYALPRALSR